MINLLREHICQLSYSEASGKMWVLNYIRVFFLYSVFLSSSSQFQSASAHIPSPCSEYAAVSATLCLQLLSKAAEGRCALRQDRQEVLEITPLRRWEQCSPSTRSDSVAFIICQVP